MFLVMFIITDTSCTRVIKLAFANVFLKYVGTFGV